MYVNKQILCNYNVDCNPQDFLFIGTDYVAFTKYLTYVLDMLSSKEEITEDMIEKCLPYSDQLPQYLKV